MHLDCTHMKWEPRIIFSAIITSFYSWLLWWLLIISRQKYFYSISITLWQVTGKYTLKSVGSLPQTLQCSVQLVSQIFVFRSWGSIWSNMVWMRHFSNRRGNHFTCHTEPLLPFLSLEMLNSLSAPRILFLVGLNLIVHVNFYSSTFWLFVCEGRWVARPIILLAMI